MYRADSSSDPPVFGSAKSAGEAEEHLRVIRQAMERSTRHSTLSGLSGIAVGLLSLGGCLLTQYALHATGPTWMPKLLFMSIWTGVALFSFLADYFFTKRRAAQVGKTAFSPLGRHLWRAAAPGLLAAVAMSFFYAFHHGLIGAYLYGVWMLCYAVSLLNVGMFSVHEVSVLGWSFLIAGCLTLLMPHSWFIGPGTMMAVTFGGFHILYGMYMGGKYGW